MEKELSVLQAGVMRSGNMWVWHILEMVAEQAGIERRRFMTGQRIYQIVKQERLWPFTHGDIDLIDILPNRTFYHIPPVFQMPVADMDDYVRNTWHVWSHSPCNKATREVLAKFPKIVYIVRDPRDALISLSHFHFTPYMLDKAPILERSPRELRRNRLDSFMREWVDHVAGYLAERESLPIHFVFYERFLCSFEEELQDLGAFLGIELVPSQIEAIKEEVSFQVMRSLSPGHARKGEYGQWVSEFSGAEKKRSLEIAGPMLKLLGYPLTLPSAGNQNGNGLPAVPNGIMASALRDSVDRAHRRTLRQKAIAIYRILRS